VEEIAGAFSAVEGLRKPVSVGRLMTVVRGIIEEEVR
jgi:hypothetical protein